VCVTVCAGNVFALTVGNYKFCSTVDSWREMLY